MLFLRKAIWINVKRERVKERMKEEGRKEVKKTTSYNSQFWNGQSHDHGFANLSGDFSIQNTDRS